MTKRYVTPQVFSLIENADETIEYFNKLSQGISEKIPRIQFLIDSSGVKFVTVDALIYLIAIIDRKSTRLNSSHM